MKIRGAPTTLAYFDGEEVGRIVGPPSTEDLEALFDSATGTTPVSWRRVSTENRKIRTAMGATLLIAGLAVASIWLCLIGTALILGGWHDYLIPNRSNE